MIVKAIHQEHIVKNANMAITGVKTKPVVSIVNAIRLARRALSAIRRANANADRALWARNAIIVHHIITI